jgi:hypothetical protein
MKDDPIPPPENQPGSLEQMALGCAACLFLAFLFALIIVHVFWS